MKIGYPCIHRTIGCTANSTFRLNSYSEERLIQAVQNNLDCLQKILEWNVKHNLLFFRISSQLVPFASHPICRFKWQTYFDESFKKNGTFIKNNNIRISMHPDQFILLNAKDEKIVKRSVAELEYHCTVLDLMQLDKTAKVQIHIGGVYGDKKTSIERFIHEYKKLPQYVKSRLVIENDDHRYSLADCLHIHKQIEVPIVFDTLHHECFNNGENFLEAIASASKTWKKIDGLLMVDYSSQEKGKRKGAHAQKIDIKHFKSFISQTKDFDFDIMLEIKDKEASALKAKNFLDK